MQKLVHSKRVPITHRSHRSGFSANTNYNMKAPIFSDFVDNFQLYFPILRKLDNLTSCERTTFTWSVSAPDSDIVHEVQTIHGNII